MQNFAKPFSRPGRDWETDESVNESPITEKPTGTQTPSTSKRYMWRLVRLGLSLALTTAALVLTLVVLVVGRHGNAGSDLALLTVDMSGFARFNPPTIQLVHNTTEPSKVRRGLDSWESDIASAGNSVETYVSGAASAVETAAGAAATAVETAVASAVASAQDEADEIIKDIGDTLEDIETAVEGLMDKVLDTIQDELNKWLQEAASALDDLDIPRKMTLHLTTSCTSDAGTDANSTKTTCSQLFTSGATSFNSTENNGTIFGFQPGNLVAKALGVFFVPESAQEDIREPIDNATNTVQKLMEEAGSDVSSWTVDLLFAPIVAVYILAVVFVSMLLLMLIAATVLTIKGGDSVPARVYSVCGTIAAVATFFLFLGSVILTVIALVAYIVGLGGNVVGISVASGSKLKWLSWSAFIIMALVTLSLKVEEFVADCVFWWDFVSRLLRSAKTKEGVRGAMRNI
ncbi:unnamed protein product [Discula destructiva]